MGYGNMAVIYQNSGELVKARELWVQSLQLFTEIGAKPKIELVQCWLDKLDQQRDN